MENTIEKKGINRDILKIAIPAIFESLFTTFISIINSKMVAKIDVTAMSAIAVTNQPRLVVLALFFAVNTAVSAMVAQAFGKKDKVKANQVLITGLVASIIGSLVLGLLCVLLAKPIMEICSGQPDTMAQSITYFRIMMGGLVFNIIFMVVNAALRGCGKTNVTFTSNVIACVVNVLVNFLIIEGRFGFPALGVAGAAISTVLGNLAASVFSVGVSLKETSFVNLKYCIKEKIQATKEVVVEMLGIWKNLALENVMLRVGMLISSSIGARIGSYEMSIYSVGINLINVSFAFGNGFQAATIALVGRSKGEGNTDKIISYTKRILYLGLISSVVLAIIFAFGSAQFYGFFNKDPEFIRLGTQVAILIVPIIPIQVIRIICAGFLQGLYKTQYTMIAGIAANTIGQPIFSFLFINVLKLKLWGLWTSVLCAQLLWFFITFYYYRKTMKELQS